MISNEMRSEIDAGLVAGQQIAYYLLFALAFESRGETEWVDYYLSWAASAELLYARANALLAQLYK